ncbi:MAG: molybdopterin-dependent oxidoreductase [Chloroflexi bacterium]|nr:molybdopterin-dependent oxidoreductase [Chloroflexota bacterium]
MAWLTIDGQPIEAPDGAPLVEVIKQNGFYVSNLCYIDGLPPYAGCRTCLVEIEGAPGLQLSCTTAVRDDMVVRGDTPEVKQARQYVLSIINANHSDRCLTCHRRVKCMPGDICLRDDVVTHRCLTCSKNYRCELQTTNDLLDMGKDNIEPWEGEERTYYQAEQPEPDRGNPWLEFDPQMCIICTRCVRACDDLRHTGAITLAGRGFTTRIAFGSGGPVHDSNCDFCGSCIDVCPTATLMEKPNKWLARTEDWVSTVCTSCSVGCTTSVGHRDGKPVIVKPDTLNPFSDDQICVRGRFHYDAIKPKERLSQHLIRRDGVLASASWDEALDHAAERLAQIRQEHGGDAIAFLGSPLGTNEENYLVQRLARDVVGSPHLDFSAGPVNRAVALATAAAFGTEALPADLLDIPTKAKTILVVADDLEESHNIAALRIKDAVDPRKLPLREPARLIVVSPRWGELCDFAEPFGGVWLQPEPGQEPAALAALARLLVEDEAVANAATEAGLQSDVVANGPEAVPGVDAEALQRAAELLREAALDRKQEVAVVMAAKPTGAALAAEIAKGAANVALLLRGKQAARSFHVLPTEANVNGARDMGVSPDVGPGRKPVSGDPGLDFTGIVEGAREGKIKALVVAGDNPLMFAPGRERVAEALSKLDFLVVIDQLLTDTAQQAHVVLADVSPYGKDGTVTSADRRVQRLRAIQAPAGDARPAWQSLSELGRRLVKQLGLKTQFGYQEAGDVTDEIARKVPGYRRFRAYGFFGWGKERAVGRQLPKEVALQPVAAVPPSTRNGDVALLTGRTLYTSLEGAALHSPEADKLHREQGVLVNQYDATELGIAMGDEVILRNGSAELALQATLTNAVPRGAVFVSSYYDGGAVGALLPPENGVVAFPRVTLSKKASPTPAKPS